MKYIVEFTAITNFSPEVGFARKNTMYRKQINVPPAYTV